MAAALLTDKDIRIFLMDKPELNPLLNGVRWSAEDIDSAVVNVISYFNSVPPATGNSYTAESFPYRYCLLIGVTGHLLRSAAINEASNQFDYVSDGVSVQDKNKAPVFASMGNSYWEEFRSQVREIKVNQAMHQLYGSIGSPFGRQGGF